MVAASIGANRYNICAKAITPAGNIRTGSGCAVNSDYRCSPLSSNSPDSQAYGYWAGTGTVLTVNGYADTNLISC